MASLDIIGWHWLHTECRNRCGKYLIISDKVTMTMTQSSHKYTSLRTCSVCRKHVILPFRWLIYLVYNLFQVTQLDYILVPRYYRPFASVFVDMSQRYEIIYWACCIVLDRDLLYWSHTQIDISIAETEANMTVYVFSAPGGQVKNYINQCKSKAKKR